MVVELPPHPRARLVPREPHIPQRTWDVDLPTRGVWRVTGQAGSGLSSFLLDTAMEAIRRTGDPDGVLVITASKESGARLRRELSERVADSGFVANEPLVRSVHSLAFAIVRQRAQDQIRLISGAEQDAVIRQLLDGNAEYGTGSWPEELRPALTFVGFARQLRDFLLRAVERQLTPDDLRQLGARHQMPIWSAAGDFLAEYQQVMRLWGVDSYSASELVAAVLEQPVESRWHTVLIDDAQHLDPTSGQLLEQLIQQADLAVVGGDLDQSVFHFRGASPAFFSSLDATTIDLGESRRTSQRQVVISDTDSTQHRVIADHVRRAHLDDGVAWSEIAVVVRSTGMLEPIHRILLQAGVPVAINPTDIVLSEQRIVAAMILGVRALFEELSTSEWRDLLLGPVGGTDPVTLRRLLRGLRRFSPDTRAEETLRQLLRPEAPLPDFGSMLTDRELDILERIRTVMQAGHAAISADGTVEDILWAVWNATGLSDRLMAHALRGGAAGSQADRDLDAMMSLFDAAGDFAERRPEAGIEAFITHISEQELPTGVRDRRTATPDAVSLLTAHGVVGLEFSHVVVAGVQEGSWPSLGETGSLFGQEDLIDLLDAGIDPAIPVSHSADRLKEERRLFHVATSRATSSLLVTAVNAPDDDEAQEPSRFIEEFCEHFGITPTEHDADDDPDWAEDIPALPSTARVLSRSDLIAELRRAVTAEDVSESVRAQATRQLARLTAASIPGAAHQEWYTTTETSTNEPLDTPRALSPSRIEGLLACPLQEVMERLIQTTSTVHMVRGSMVHAYFEAIGNGADEELARRETMEAYEQVQEVPSWQRESDLEQFERLLDRTSQWVSSSRAAFTLVGTELPVDVEVTPDLRIRGRLDRLEHDGEGRAIIVDLKTGKNAPTVDATRDNAQLTAYQLALAHGTLGGNAIRTARGDEDPIEVGGALLVHPATAAASVTTRDQVAKTDEELAEFTQRVTPLIDELTGPTITARTGPQCEHCPVRAMCPVQPEGEDITRG
ncbi:ATP-dependent DNA helicase [Corynebacterium pilosum]|uniref:DNA 3'-5' helicase n=1 Tax=Corynebacterium pilosum TaxID=35756 RepID=A0A376CNG0_9CORY|nr:ATP-dependent DNA helicase [Corynebacterium pilosum]STC69873.1 helicase, UVRD/REP family protein [Corynebacterium pilosum]